MSRVCQLTGKRPGSGNNVSHSQRKSRRRWLPNLIKQKFFLPSQNRWVTLKISARALRTIKKLGIEKAIKKYGLKV